MSRTLIPGEDLATATRRIATAELSAALDELRPSSSKIDARVHSMRKRMKRLRALLRLVRYSIEERCYRTLNEAFRDAARQLSGAREAAVRIKGLGALCEASSLSLPSEFEATLRSRLSHSRSSQVGSTLSTRVESAREGLMGAERQLQSMTLEPPHWPLIHEGFQRGYARGKTGLDHVLCTLTTEAFHEWRKWVKYHMHHVELLGVTWPAELELRAGSLKELADALGDEHDLADLRDALLREPIGELSAGPTEVLLRALDQRRRQLREQALRLGARLYAESPKAFSKRTERYYAAWYDETSRELEVSRPEER